MRQTLSWMKSCLYWHQNSPSWDVFFSNNPELVIPSDLSISHITDKKNKINEQPNNNNNNNSKYLWTEGTKRLIYKIRVRRLKKSVSSYVMLVVTPVLFTGEDIKYTKSFFFSHFPNTKHTHVHEYWKVLYLCQTSFHAYFAFVSVPLYPNQNNNNIPSIRAKTSTINLNKWTLGKCFVMCDVRKECLFSRGPLCGCLCVVGSKFGRKFDTLPMLF